MDEKPEAQQPHQAAAGARHRTDGRTRVLSNALSSSWGYEPGRHSMQPSRGQLCMSSHANPSPAAQPPYASAQTQSFQKLNAAAHSWEMGASALPQTRGPRHPHQPMPAFNSHVIQAAPLPMPTTTFHHLQSPLQQPTSSLDTQAPVPGIYGAASHLPHTAMASVHRQAKPSREQLLAGFQTLAQQQQQQQLLQGILGHATAWDWTHAGIRSAQASIPHEALHPGSALPSSIHSQAPLQQDQSLTFPTLSQGSQLSLATPLNEALVAAQRQLASAWHVPFAAPAVQSSHPSRPATAVGSNTDGPGECLLGSPIDGSSLHHQQSWSTLHPYLAQDTARRLQQPQQPANAGLHTTEGDLEPVHHPYRGPTTLWGVPSPQSGMQGHETQQTLAVPLQGVYSKEQGSWQTLGIAEEAMGSVGQVPRPAGQGWAGGQQATGLQAQGAAAPAVERCTHGAMALPHVPAGSAVALEQTLAPRTNQSNIMFPANQQPDTGSMQNGFSWPQQGSNVHQVSPRSHREQQQGGARSGSRAQQPLQRSWLQNSYTAQARPQQQLQEASELRAPLHAQAQVQLDARSVTPDSGYDEAQREAGQVPPAAHMPAGALQAQHAEAKAAHLLQLQQMLAQHNRQAQASRRVPLLHHAELDAKRQAVAARLAPSPSPFLAVPSILGGHQLREIVMALRSGLPDVVPWALNAFSVASFSARAELQLPSLPGLLPALLQVIEDGIADPCEVSAEMARINAELAADDWPGLRPPRKRQKSEPGEPQGFWWEACGLFSDGGAEDERFTWAVCASNILRNLACCSANLGGLAQEPCISTLVRCLSEQSQVQSAGYNELALSCLDVLTAVIGAMSDAALLRGMLSVLCAALRPGARPPVRLRLAAAQLIARAFALHAPMPPDIFQSLSQELADSMVGLLSVGIEEAEQAIHDETGGSCGPPQVTPAEATSAAVQQAAVVLQADALAAASQALKALLSHAEAGGAMTKAAVEGGRVVPVLVQVAVGHWPAPAPELPKGQALPMPEALAAHADDMLDKARNSCVACLMQVLSSSTVGKKAVHAERADLLAAAVSDTPDSDALAVVLLYMDDPVGQTQGSAMNSHEHACT